MKLAHSLLIAGFAAIVACGHETSDQQSTTTDISIPGSPSATNQLMWYDTSIVYIGTCVAGRLPNRDNCSAIKNITYNNLLEELRRDLFSDTDSRKFKRNLEVTNLKNNHPVIVNLNHEISVLGTDISTLNAQKPALDTAKNAVINKIADLSSKISDYDEQIRNVIARLQADPSNDDLKRLKTVLESERTDLLTRLATAEGELHKLEFDLNELIARVNSKLAERDLKVAERTRKWNELLVTSDLLVQLDKEILAIDVEEQHKQRVLDLLLDNNISHRSELLGESDRKVIARIRSSITSTTEYQFNELFTLSENGTRYGITPLSISSMQVACRSVGRTYKSYSTATYASDMYRFSYTCKGDEKNLAQCSRSNAVNARDTYKIICE